MSSEFFTHPNISVKMNRSDYRYSSALIGKMLQVG